MTTLDVPHIDILPLKRVIGEKRLRINVIGQKTKQSPKRGLDGGFIVYSREREVRVLIKLMLPRTRYPYKTSYMRLKVSDRVLK